MKNINTVIMLSSPKGMQTPFCGCMHVTFFKKLITRAHTTEYQYGSKDSVFYDQQTII